MNAAQLQNLIVDFLRRTANPQRNLSEELAEVLHISTNAAYKRLSGYTPFQLDEVLRLAQHYQMPLGYWLSASDDRLLAEFSGFKAISSSLKYLDGVREELQGILQLADYRLQIANSGLSDFYFFLFDELTLFRFYIWQRLQWRDPEWDELPFSFDLPHKEELLTRVRKLLGYYFRLNVEQIWSESIFDSIYQQTRYLLEANLFRNPEDALVILRKLSELYSHLYEMAKTGRLFPPEGTVEQSAGKVKTFVNQCLENTNVILLEGGEQATVYAILDNPNFLKIKDPKICTYVKGMFERLLARSEQVSELGERSRRDFFQRLKIRMAFFEKEIQRHVDSRKSINSRLSAP
ncbi:MAG: hypothetical protein D6816_16610 [Bacteroidetes bacterium]|nr:MAG: hypothetical protein D6816_16610 [Bacteroidota bacterium]